MLLVKQEYTSSFLSEICCMNDEKLTFVGGTADLAKLLGYSEEEIKEKSKETRKRGTHRKAKSKT